MCIYKYLYLCFWSNPLKNLIGLFGLEIWKRSTGIGSVFLIHPTGQKRQEKKRFFLEWGRNAFVRHAAFSKHDAILQRIQPWPPKNPIPT